MKSIIRIVIALVLCFNASALRAQILTGPLMNPANEHLYYLVGPTTWTDAEAQAIPGQAHLNFDAE